MLFAILLFVDVVVDDGGGGGVLKMVIWICLSQTRAKIFAREGGKPKRRVGADLGAVNPVRCQMPGVTWIHPNSHSSGMIWILDLVLFPSLLEASI